MRRLSAVLLILFCLAGTSAAPPPDGLSKKFLGAWRLVSIEGNPPGRTKVYDRPTGLIMYDPSGHMCVNIVLKADRKPFAPFTKGLLNATTEEKATAFDTYAAYFGTYAVDANAGTVTHHLEDNLVPGRQSTDNVRWFEFQGADRLLLFLSKTAKAASSPAKTPPTDSSGSASSRGAACCALGDDHRHGRDPILLLALLAIPRPSLQGRSTLLQVKVNPICRGEILLLGGVETFSVLQIPGRPGPFSRL